MTRNLKKLSITGLVAVLIIVLAGCSSTAKDSAASNAPATASAPASSSSADPAESAAPVEPVTLSIFGVANSQIITSPFQDDDVSKELEKKTGVKLDHTAEMNVSDPAQKLAVMLAGNELPDIVVFNSLTDRDKIINSGAAIPLDDLVAKFGPDIQKNAGDALKVSKLMMSDDTHSLYYLPGSVGSSSFPPLWNDNSWNLRWDLYKQLNYPKLDTLDDLTNVLGEMQKLEPTNKGGKKNYGLGLNLSDDWGQLMIDKAIANLQGFVQAGPNDVYIDMGTEKLVPRISDPNSIFWKSTKFYNTAYQKGILDPESATLKFNAISDKYKTGRYFAATTHWSLGGADTQFIADGQPEKGFAPFMVDYNKQNIYVGQATFNGNQFYMLISKNCKNPEAAMKFINYLYTYEGTELLMNGVEGAQYDMVNNVPIVKDEEIKQQQEDPNHYVKTGVGKYIHMARLDPDKDPAGYPVNFMNVPETAKKLATTVQKEFMDYYKISTVTEPFTKVPAYVYDTSLLGSISPATGSDAQAKEQQMNAYLIANIAKVIYQKTDADYDKMKAKFIAEYTSKGATDVFNFYNQKYEELTAQLKK